MSQPAAKKGQLKMMIDPFLLWQIDRLKPAYGPSRAEVVAHILQSWLGDHGTAAFAHMERVQHLMAVAAPSQERP